MDNLRGNELVSTVVFERVHAKSAAWPMFSFWSRNKSVSSLKYSERAPNALVP